MPVPAERASGAGAEAEVPRRRSSAAVAVIGAGVVLIFAVLVGLGTWQLDRLSWKLDLIAGVEQRVHAAPTAPPSLAAWGEFSAEADQYRHVTVSGTFLDDRETPVQAVTALGGGFWILSPFRTDAGYTVLVNRGFVPPERRDPSSRRAGDIAGRTTVTGLLRLSEPGGAFLRSNDPRGDRWYSRDVAAIAAARGLGPVAPYFIDADATPNPGGGPVGGLTVIAFPNNHLVYALTWYGLAAMLAGAAIWVVRDERRSRGTGQNLSDPPPRDSLGESTVRPIGSRSQ